MNERDKNVLLKIREILNARSETDNLLVTENP